MLPFKRGVSLSPSQAKYLQTPIKKQRKNSEIVPSSVSGEEDNAWSSDSDEELGDCLVCQNLFINCLLIDSLKTVVTDTNLADQARAAK